MSEELREKTVVADNMRIDWDVPIAMDDGIVLRADVFRPVAEGQYPAIVTYGPYGKGLPFQVGYPDQWRIMTTRHPDVMAGSTNKYQNWEVADPEKWVPHGYVFVRVDSRGAGRSPGFMDTFAPREWKDFYACIEWAAAQSWCSGKIGLLGISYYAMTQWFVAQLQPPHLAAIIPWEGSNDSYREMYRHGGILSEFTHNWYMKQVEHVQHGYGDRGFTDPNSGLLVAGPETLPLDELKRNRADVDAALDHPLDDEFYRERAVDWSKVTVPLLSAANWGGQPLHPRGNFNGFTQSASKQKWLEVHGLEHWTHFYTDYGVALQRRFFDYFLKGIDNGWNKQPPVQLQIRHVDKFVERFENEWPIARTRWTRLYLDPARQALDWKPIAQESQQDYKALSDGVTLLSEPFEHETEITGPVALKLFLAASTTDADLFATVRLFDPDGKEIDFIGALDPHTPVAQGWLRASQRKLDPVKSTAYQPYHPHNESWPLTPGQVYELDVEVWPTCIVVPVGYRLGLTLQGKDFERPVAAQQPGSFVNPFRGSGPFTHTMPRDRPAEVFDNQHTIFSGGAQCSYLLLPLIPTR